MARARAKRSEASTDATRARLTKLCLALPEAECNLVRQHAQYQVRGRTFGYLLEDHHGDGILGFTCKAAAGASAELVARDPTRFYIPAYLGTCGWIALRLDVGPIDWDEVARLARASYALVAPKRLAALATSTLARRTRR